MTYAAGSDVDPEGQKVRTNIMQLVFTLYNCIASYSILGTTGARIP